MDYKIHFAPTHLLIQMREVTGRRFTNLLGTDILPR